MVNGVAAGAGFNLALACDIVFASDTARFAQSFVKVGLVPDCGGMYLLPKIVGTHKAKELMFTADLINAAKANELGLLNRVIESDKLEEETFAFAEKLLLSAPIALGMVKQTLNGMEDMTLENWLVHEADMQTLCMQTKDHQEGINAFLEKRAPEFKNQ
jgi:2-(1,2-epoxy-1,2-dihydrophenyl)acetyl-CoA isomerase